MFTHVGRRQSGNRRRRAGSLVLSLMLVTSTATALVFSGSQHIEDEGLIAVVDMLYPEESAPRAMPAPPPPKGVEDGGATEETPPEEPPEETPDEAPPEVLDEDPPPADEGSSTDPDATTDAPKGLEIGSDDGIDGGKPGGTGTEEGGECVGPECGECSGPNCSQSITMHYSQLRFRTKVIPTFPRAAKKLGLTSEDCQVRVEVDVRGRPSDIEVLSCPSVFHDELIRAASKWRFYPAESGGYPVPARTVIPVHFRLN